MKRFYGSAVFEGEEVADSAFTSLQDIRAEEVRLVEYHNREFQMQINKLNVWRQNELATIASNAARLINEQNRLISRAYQQINTIQMQMGMSIASIPANVEAAIQIREQQRLINSYRNEIERINADRHRAIANVHREYAIEYNIRLRRRDKDIAWTHADATDKIAAVFAKRYYLPVFMMRCAKGPCEYCRAKYGTTGTYDELVKLDCVPPFHDDCRCWLEEVGYVVMTR